MKLERIPQGLVQRKEPSRAMRSQARIGAERSSTFMGGLKPPWRDLISRLLLAGCIVRFVGFRPTNQRLVATFPTNFPLVCWNNPNKQGRSNLINGLLVKTRQTVRVLVEEARWWNHPSYDDVRISYTDLAIALAVVATTDHQGKGAIRRIALVRSIPADRVTYALDRVEAAFGGRSFLERGLKRTGKVTPAGQDFLVEGNRLQKAWHALTTALNGRSSDCD